MLYYDESLRRDPAYGHALWDKGLALQAEGDNAGAIKAWEAFSRLFPADSPDVIQVKKWMAKARGRLVSTSAPPDVPEALKKLSKQSSKNLVKGNATE